MEDNLENIQYGSNEYQNKIEIKDSIKIVKNSKGFNYEFKVYEKEGISLFEQIDNLKKEIDKRLLEWK